MAVSGACLCGAVRFEITGPTTDIGMCHCSLCRKVSGVASNATLIAGLDRFQWIRGADQIVKFELPSGWGPWRCAICGSPLPKLRPDGGAYWIPAGLLDSDPGVRVAGHIFVDSKAPWDEVAGTAPQYSENFGSTRLK